MRGKPRENDAESSAFAQSATNVPVEEQPLDGEKLILVICRLELFDDLVVRFGTERGYGEVDVEKCLASGTITRGTVFRIDDVGICNLFFEIVHECHDVFLSFIGKIFVAHFLFSCRMEFAVCAKGTGRVK